MAWTEDFQRLVLVSALRGDLLDQLPLESALFGSANERGSTPPRQRIADVLLKYVAEYGGRPPLEAMQQLVAEVGARLGPEERLALSDEIVLVAATDLPTDNRFVRDRVRTAMELRAVERGLVQAADALAAGEVALPAVRELLARALQPLDGAETRRIEYLAGADERMEMWRRGDEYGERISTGFPELDRAMRGGPTRRESHYFLAPPKGAKTAALLNVGAAALRRGLGVYLTTYEMQSIRMALRVDRLMANSTKEELEADLSNLERAFDGLRAIGAPELYIDERPPQRPGSVADAAVQIEGIRRRGGKIDVVIFDYLNIMGSAKDEDEKRHELPRISREINNLAKQLDVLAWSAALVNRAAVNKKVVRKTDIAEAFEVVAVADGMIAICATLAMIRAGLRRFRVVASREEQDEVNAGDYRVDFGRQRFNEANDEEIVGINADEGESNGN